MSLLPIPVIDFSKYKGKLRDIIEAANPIIQGFEVFSRNLSDENEERMENMERNAFLQTGA